MIALEHNNCDSQQTVVERDSLAISRFDISASGIGLTQIHWLFRPGLVEWTCRAHMRSEWPMIIVGL